MRSPLRALGVTLTLIALAGSSVTALDQQEPFDRATAGSERLATNGGMSHVFNFPYTGGSDIEFTTIDGRDYAVLGRLNKSVLIFDITDPTDPFQVGEIDCRLYQNDIQITGTTLVMAADSRSSCHADGGTTTFIGFALADISDPSDPIFLAAVNIPEGAHNLTVHPAAPVVYVSNSDLIGTGEIHLWDISDPWVPAKITDWAYHPLHPPHDITFNADGTRAYVAAITHTDIFDTTDADSPVMLHSIVHPTLNISHQADPTPDGRFLLVSDELAGAATGPVCPGGGVHVYDISNELLPPVKVGVFWADNVERSGVCTAHVFRINPDGETMAIAWYNAGVHVIDFGDMLKIGIAGSGNLVNVGVRTIASMKMPGADTWSAKMWQERHPGYVFANDIARGFDIFFVPELA